MKSSLNILIANTLYLPNIGGVENYIWSVAKTFSQNGHKVNIVCSDHNYSDNQKLPSFESREEADVFRYHYYKSIFGFVYQILSARKLVKKLNEEVGEYDKILARSHQAVLFCRLAGLRKIIYVVPGVYANQYINRKRWLKPKSFLAYFANVMVQWIALRITYDAVVLSDSMYDQVRTFSKNSVKLRKVPPGVDSSRFYPRNEIKKNSLRSELNLPLKVNIILGLGRFAPVKGYKYAIDALEYLDNDFHLVLVGEGPLRTSLKERAKKKEVSERVHIHNATSTPEFYYGAADLFLLSSTYESFGQVLMEATASGLPIVAFSQKAGVKTSTEEIYQGYETLVQFSDECSGKAIAKEIIKTNKLQSMSNRNFIHERNRFLDSYSWDKVANNLLYE